MAAQKNYLPRVADLMVEESLGYSGGVLLEGVRHAPSEVALDSGLPQLRAALDADPSLVLAGEAPRLIDGGTHRQRGSGSCEAFRVG